MFKIMSVIATRPDAIKMCPLINEIYKHNNFEQIVVSTGQHIEMVDEVLKIFNVKLDENLNIMTNKQSLFSITGKVMDGMRELYEKYMPDLVLVHGDTTSAFSSALAAYYMKISIGHVEAGLRTYNMYSPYPEEFNRFAIDHLSDVCFAPTQYAKKQLLSEGIREEKIYVTGNTIVDALNVTKDYGNCDEIIKWANNRKIILLTSHRRENIGQKMDDIFTCVKDVINENKEYCCVYPVHLNPSVMEIAHKSFDKQDNVLLCKPLNVLDFHKLMSLSTIILTDSGGIQEEAPAFNVPVLVCRDTTERPEGIEAGIAKLCGTNYEVIKNNLIELINNKEIYENMQKIVNPYGDGFSSKRICDIIETKYLK